MAEYLAALSTSNIQKIIPQEWDASWQTYQSAWMQHTTILTMSPDGTGSIRLVAVQPFKKLAAWDGTSDITAASYGVTHTNMLSPADFAQRYDFKRADVIHSPGLVQAKLVESYNAVDMFLNTQVYSGYPGGFSDTVPDGNGSTTAVFSASHRYGSTPSSQSNLQTAALSNAAAATFLQRSINWKNANGDPAGLGYGKKFIICAPANLETATQIANNPLKVVQYASPTLAATGSDLNILAGMYSVDVSPFLGDAAGGDDDDWFITEQRPDGSWARVIWVAGTPHITIVEDEKNHKVIITVSMRVTTSWAAWIGGVFGSNVA